MAARVWGQPAGGFCSREDGGRPSDADPTAGRSREQRAGLPAQGGGAGCWALLRRLGLWAAYARESGEPSGLSRPRAELEDGPL